MPNGNTEILEYEDDPSGDDFGTGLIPQKIRRLGTGPENYLTYTIDCYQLYLWYMGWGDRPLAGRMPFVEFVTEVLKEPKIKIIKNWRYKASSVKTPNEIRPFLGKMFLGVRFLDKLTIAEDRMRY